MKLFVVAIFDPGVYQPLAAVVRNQDDLDTLLKEVLNGAGSSGWRAEVDFTFAKIAAVRSWKRLQPIGTISFRKDNESEGVCSVYAHLVKPGRPVGMSYSQGD